MIIDKSGGLRKVYVCITYPITTLGYFILNHAASIPDTERGKTIS